MKAQGHSEYANRPGKGPQRFPWMPVVIAVVAVAIVVGGIIVGVSLGIRFF